MGALKNIFTFPFRLREKRKADKYFKHITLSQIDSLNGYDFEEYIALLFESVGFKCDKTHKSKDNGVDIIAIKNNIRLAIQTKLYYNHKVGNKAIQEVYTGNVYHKCNIPIVITNSYFSQPAINIAQEFKVLLIDRKSLHNIINSNKNDKIYYFENMIYNYINNNESD